MFTHNFKHWTLAREQSKTSPPAYMSVPTGLTPMLDQTKFVSGTPAPERHPTTF